MLVGRKKRFKASSSWLLMENNRFLVPLKMADMYVYIKTEQNPFVYGSSIRDYSVYYFHGCTIWCLHDLEKMYAHSVKLSNKLELNHKMHRNLERK